MEELASTAMACGELSWMEVAGRPSTKVGYDPVPAMTALDPLGAKAYSTLFMSYTNMSLDTGSKAMPVGLIKVRWEEGRDQGGEPRKGRL